MVGGEPAWGSLGREARIVKGERSVGEGVKFADLRVFWVIMNFGI